MLDVRAASIIYQSQVALASLVDGLVTSKRSGKTKDLIWQKCLLIRRHLKALEYVDRLSDQTQATYILECLIQLTGINDFPVAPVLTLSIVPNILVGVKGDTGDKGNTGATGPTGLATDVQVGNIVSDTLIDSFSVSVAPGVRWDYTITEASGAQRSGTVTGTWSSTGSAFDFADSATPDIIGPTTGLEFDIQFSAGNIQLIARITSGTWFVRLSRYFIPNNGNGSGPVGSVLLDNRVYIGNAANVATGVLLSGVITTTNTGVTLLSNGVVSNVHIAGAAAIAVNKLAALTASKLVVSDTNGFLTTVNVTATEASYIAGATSNLQSQITAGLVPSLTANRIVITNGSGGLIANPLMSTNRVTKWNGTQLVDSLISDDGSIITVSGIKITGVAAATTASDVVRFDQLTITGTPNILFKRLDIPSWDMSTATGISFVNIAHGITSATTKIISVQATIFIDGGGAPVRDSSYVSSSPGSTPGVGIEWDGANVVVRRVQSGSYDNTNYDGTGFNRGCILIFYLP